MSSAALATLVLLVVSGCAEPDTEPSHASEPTFQCEPKSTSEYAAHGATLTVASASCVDASGPLRDGAIYEWLYIYDRYSFASGDIELSARSYADTSEAHFLGISESGESRFLAVSDFQRPLVLAAIQYLSEAGKAEITWLDPNNDLDGYSPVPER
ncbi:MAG: hypothetical protein QNK03_07125 [Myxococcota bacterium]|nr:hypothetical protein [Myxococcota bacterium]